MQKVIADVQPLNSCRHINGLMYCCQLSTFSVDPIIITDMVHNMYPCGHNMGIVKNRNF